MRPFRFGIQADFRPTKAKWTEFAKKVEASGYDIITIGGIATSANEALSAVSTARTRNLHNHPHSFDATGLRKSLVEWYSFDSVKHSINTLLSPLNKLSTEKKRGMIVTLSTYLDFQCSLNKTASELHLHRNAVSYRVKQAFKLLEVDPNDSDQVLFLHLACKTKKDEYELSDKPKFRKTKPTQIKCK